MEGVLRTLTWAGMIFQGFSLFGQSFTQTVGGQNAQDGIGTRFVDDGYLIGVRDFNGSEHLGRLFTMSGSGSLLSTSTLSQTHPHFLQGLVSLPDGTSVLYGSGFSAEDGDHDAMLVKLDDTGAIASTWLYTGPGSAQYLGAVGLPDGSVVACGLRAMDGRHEALIARHDPSGQEIWSYVHPSLTDVEAYGITVNGTELLITGRQMNFSGQSDIVLMQLDVDGTFNWSTTLGGSFNEEGRAVIPTNTGGCVIAGWTDSFGTFDQTSQSIPRHAILAAFDLSGDTLWTRTLGDTLHGHQAFAMVQATNGDLLVGGERFSSAISDAYLARVTALGELLWERTVDTGKEERIVHLLPLPDDGVVCTGWSFGPFGRQVLFLRRSALGY